MDAALLKAVNDVEIGQAPGSSKGGDTLMFSDIDHHALSSYDDFLAPAPSGVATGKVAAATAPPSEGAELAPSSDQGEQDGTDHRDRFTGDIEPDLPDPATILPLDTAPSAFDKLYLYSSPWQPRDEGDEGVDDTQSTEWVSREKHVFILSIAGKPIYSRYGQEDKLSSIMGVMQALVSFVQEGHDQLRTVTAGAHRFVFQVKGPLILVMASRTGESEAQMCMQLNYVYSQIIFVLTRSQLLRIFEQRINYDLRRMLGGTEKFIDSLLNLMERNPSFFLSAVRCLRLPSALRDKIGHVLVSTRVKDLVFAVLVAKNQLITLLRPKKYSLHPADLHLIFNLVSASTSFQSAECWTPLCLPRFDSAGFLHAHVSYIDDAGTACLLLISNKKDAFHDLSEGRAKIVQALSANGTLQAISQALETASYRMRELDIPDLRHFLYKSKSTAQFTSPALDPPYTLPSERTRLFRRYQSVYNHIHTASHPLKIYFTTGPQETLLGWVTSGFELYACFGALVTKPAAINAVLRLIRWMKIEEDKLFILNSQVF